MGDIFKKVLWWLLVAMIALAVFRGVGSLDNIWPWMNKQSINFQHFIEDLVKKFPTDNLKPLPSILPKKTPGS